MKVYLSGTISGGGTLDEKTIRANQARFATAATLLRERGHDVVSPVEVNGDDQPGHVRRTWAEYMARALIALWDCDRLVQLPGWEDSPGAVLEHAVAVERGMPVSAYTECEHPDPEVEVYAGEIDRYEYRRCPDCEQTWIQEPAQ